MPQKEASTLSQFKHLMSQLCMFDHVKLETLSQFASQTQPEMSEQYFRDLSYILGAH